MSESLTDFLLARIAEREATAQAAEGRHGIYPASWWGQAANRWSHGERPASVSPEDAALIAQHDPKHVLARCAADRQIVEIVRDGLAGKPQVGRTREGQIVHTLGHSHDLALILQQLAVADADHADYREEWRP